jgi:Fic family protein
VLQEAKDSSAVENIITTHDELFQAEMSEEKNFSWETKEVLNYTRALKKGFELVRQKGYISINMILQIQEELERNRAGFRRTPGTVLRNDRTGEVVYTPPQHYDTIVDHMHNLEQYLNNADDETDHLIRMAIIHHQFESIHPFYDGNGRTGRILNILYLTLHRLLDYPILYLSRYLIRNKPDYYRLLQLVRREGRWEEWILFMLQGIMEIARETIWLIGEIRQLMDRYKREIREKLPNLYSKDLLENLFKHPYTKIEYLASDTGRHYQTARTHLEKLCEAGFLEKHPVGKTNLYLNRPLYQLFMQNENRIDG